MVGMHVHPLLKLESGRAGVEGSLVLAGGVTVVLVVVAELAIGWAGYGGGDLCPFSCSYSCSCLSFGCRLEQE